MLSRLRISMRLRSTNLLLALCFAGCSTVANPDKPKPVESAKPHIPETICPLHHVALQEAMAPVGPDHVSYLDEYLAAREREFPRANTGMTWPFGEQRYTRVRYCPACREAKAKWEADFDRSRQQQASRG